MPSARTATVRGRATPDLIATAGLKAAVRPAKVVCEQASTKQSTLLIPLLRSTPKLRLRNRQATAATIYMHGCNQAAAPKPIGTHFSHWTAQQPHTPSEQEPWSRTCLTTQMCFLMLYSIIVGIAGSRPQCAAQHTQTLDAQCNVLAVVLPRHKSLPKRPNQEHCGYIQD
jgi:hypothetical protein